MVVVEVDWTRTMFRGGGQDQDCGGGGQDHDSGGGGLDQGLTDQRCLFRVMCLIF